GEGWGGRGGGTRWAACSGIGGPAAFRLRSYPARQRPPAPRAFCARRQGTCPSPAPTAGLAARFCRRDRGRLREPFPAHALGMDRIGPCLPLGYCRLPTQPCEHGDSVMSLRDLARSSLLSPPLPAFLTVEVGARPDHPIIGMRRSGVSFRPVVAKNSIQSDSRGQAESQVVQELGCQGRRSVPGGCFAHTVSTVEPTVLRDSRSRCACAASFSG